LYKLYALLNTEGVNLEPRDRKGRTPLLAAVQLGHVRKFKMLLNHGGIDANPTHYGGRTPLVLAVLGNKLRSARTLLQYSTVDVNAADPRTGEPPLLLAARF
jgi:ankyrin repeat protein